MKLSPEYWFLTNTCPSASGPVEAKRERELRAISIEERLSMVRRGDVRRVESIE